MALSIENKGKGKSAEEIYAGLQKLRVEQRQLANKITELEMDLNEHNVVAETLKAVEKSRKCFRMIGGVLVELTVEAVLPELEHNREQLPKAIQVLNEQLTKKGQEINQYITTHKIERKVQNTEYPEKAEAKAEPKSNVLVSNE